MTPTVDDNISQALKVTLVLLAYNEADAIEATVRAAASELEKQFEPGAWELLIIDDGSRDATPRILAALQADIPALRVHTHNPNAGYVEATRSALREGRGEYICVFDGDGQ